MSEAQTERDIEVLLWGVTGWTGVHMLEYFVEEYPLTDQSHGIRWAVVARNGEKMQRTMDNAREYFKAEWLKDIEQHIVDNSDEEAINALLPRAKAVLTVVGPYAKYGETLVKACVENRTHYFDITGETNWIQKMISKYEDQAKSNGTILMSCCGFDSVPSDLTSRVSVDFLTQTYIEKNPDVDPATIEKSFKLRGFFTKMTSGNRAPPGQAGGGTLASILGLMGEKGVPKDDYNMLTGSDDENTADKNTSIPWGVWRHSELKDKPWSLMFPMAVINEKIVRRSRYLLPDVFGKSLSYKEKMAIANPFVAVLANTAMIGFLGLLKFKFVRDFVEKNGPQPSSTPPPRPRGEKYVPGVVEYVQIAEGEFKVAGGKTQKLKSSTTFLGLGDGGWTLTGIMLAECGLSVVTAEDKIKDECKLDGGYLTSACLGQTLKERLEKTKFSFKSTLL